MQTSPLIQPRTSQKSDVSWPEGTHGFHHRGDLLGGQAALLDLRWHAPPYPADSSPPGSVIRLTSHGDGTVSAAFLSSVFDGEHAGAVREVSATIDSKASMPLWELQKRVNETIDWACVRAS